MSENSPRWPGANGSPGLDFSPQRRGGVKEDPSPREAADDSATRLTPKLSDDSASTVEAWSVTPASEAAVGKSSPVLTRSSDANQPTSTLSADRNPAAGAKPAGDTKSGVVKPMVGSQGPHNRRTRKARLRLSRIDPWSVMKTSFLFSIAFGVMLVVAVFVLWSVLAGSGALESVNALINTLISSEGDSSFRVEDILNSSRVLGFATVIAAIDVVILTAVATLFAFLYNLSATMLGGLEVTLAED